MCMCNQLFCNNEGWGRILINFEKNSIQDRFIIVTNLLRFEIYLSTPFITNSILRKTILNFNHFHNILRLFDVLAIFPFTTSDKKCGYY